MPPKKASLHLPKFPPASSSFSAASDKIQSELFNLAYFKTAHLEDDADFQKAHAIVEAEWARRYQILFDHFGISEVTQDEEHRLRLLVFLLATIFVPGFSPHPPAKSKRGRPISITKHIELAKEIDRLIAENQMSVIAACRYLAKRTGKWKGQKPTELQAAYYRYRSADKTPGDITFLFKK